MDFVKLPKRYPKPVTMDMWNLRPPEMVRKPKFIDLTSPMAPTDLHIITPPPPPPPEGYFEWTTFTESIDTIKIYVSSSTGSDTTGNGTIGNPYQSIPRGYQDLRSGYPDWLLLKCGDTWTVSTIYFTKSGRSTNEKMLFGSYGTGSRPTIQIHSADLFYIVGCNYTAFVGLNLYAYRRDPDNINYDPNAVNVYMHCFVPGYPVNDLLIEDCKISWFTRGFVMEGGSGGMNTVKIRGCVIHNCYANTNANLWQSGLGSYFYHVNNLLIEGNTWDHNGWHETIPYATKSAYGHANYTYDCSNVSFINNIYTRNPGACSRWAGSDYYNTNGFVQYNIYTQNGIAITTNSIYEISGYYFDGFVFKNNYIGNQGNVLSDGEKWSRGILYQYIRNLTIENNICAHKTFEDPVPAIQPWGNYSREYVTIRNNIVYDYYHGINSIDEFTDPALHILVENNEDHLPESTYVDPTRSIASYSASIGGLGTEEDFIQHARMQSKSNYDERYTARAVWEYISAGFLHR